jgi:aminopeptidase-like protein
MTMDPMYDWACDLFPICRSLTGPGVRLTLDYLGELLPGLRRHDIASGSRAFDWTVPDEWTIRDAYIADESGRRLVDFQMCNLHVVGYSEPVDAWLSREELEPHLHSLPEMPDAIPYVTSYYARRWGFCLSDRQRRQLGPGRYHAKIDATLAPGRLDYADLVLPGDSTQEVLFSTYVCHPSMANNELSGPVVTTALARWLAGLPRRRYSYRFVFVPETLGSIVYLSRNLAQMKERTVAGFVVNCCGDRGPFSYLPTPRADTLADRVALHVLERSAPGFVRHSYRERGSDERQYCSAGAGLPVGSIMRSKYACYPEYHTSLDDLSLISQEELERTFAIYREVVTTLENNRIWRVTQPCEPQLGRHGLYPTTGGRIVPPEVVVLRDVLAYADGTEDILAIAERIGAPVAECIEIADKLHAAGLIEPVDEGAAQRILNGKEPPLRADRLHRKAAEAGV